MNSSDFFDLTQFEHAALFATDDYPWNALTQLETYLKKLPLGQQRGHVSSQAFLIHPELIFIGEDSVIEAGAYIQGPCWLGKGCMVRHGAYIRGNLITGDHCVIGHATEIKQAILLDGAQAAHFAYVGNTILGNRVNLGAGTKCANFRLDHKEICIHTPYQIISTGMRKLGAIVGDRAQIGCNTVLNPGTLVGKDVKCYPCLNLGGFIAAHTSIKGSVQRC